MKLALFLLLGIALPTHATIFEAQIEQTSPQVGSFGEFRLWLPPSAHPDQILVVVWGSNQCSLGIADDPAWEELAGSIHCGLLACFFYPQATENHWDHAAEGSGAALLEALRTFAATTGESQLTNAPLYLVGDSQGGQFAFSFAAWKSARVLGFVSLKGGHHDAIFLRDGIGVPGLFIAGEFDAPFRIANIEDIFSKGRARGAPWCLAIDPHGKHDPGPCGPLVSAFLQALSKEYSRSRSKTRGLLAKPDTRPSVGSIPSWSWFPGPIFKHDWESFESGTIESSSPPLGFESRIPAAQGTVTPTSEDLGLIESGVKSQPFSLEIISNGTVDWDGISVLNCSYLSDTRVVETSPNHFTLYACLSTTELPLGRFTGVIPLRFNLRGKTILGGVNVPLTATVTGDIVATPSLIFLAGQSKSTESIHIKITSKTKQRIKLLAYQAPPGIRVEPSVMPAEPFELTIVCDISEKNPQEQASGSILLHLKTDKEWILRIPYIASSPN